VTTHATETAPIQKSIVVPLPVEKAFRLFTDGVSGWWPGDSHSIEGDKVESVTFDVDARRVYERTADGTEHDWADITAWQPPNRFLLNWRVNPANAGTEVEVRFEPEGGGTRVELEHRGWDTAGPPERSNYDSGWEFVLGKYAGAAG
jgi:uncharacterized protein YndB with AHSA1/START domain